MFTRENSHERWSDEDDELLRTMSKAGKSITLITVKLNRSISSIKARAADIGVGIPVSGDQGRLRNISGPWAVAGYEDSITFGKPFS